jgi:DNA helicase-2/ATP-dependent DNA helicase PcrA
VADVEQLLANRRALNLSGDPGVVWLAVRQLFADVKSPELQEIAQDAKYLRLLHKGEPSFELR